LGTRVLLDAVVEVEHEHVALAVASQAAANRIAAEGSPSSLLRLPAAAAANPPSID